MYVPYIFLYINFCNHTMFFLYSLHSSGLLITLKKYQSSLYSLQYHKTSEHRIIMRHSNNMYETNKSDDTVPTSILSHLPDAVQSPQCMNQKPFITPRERDAEQVLSMMSGDGNLGYWYLKTIHYLFHRRNDDDGIPEEEGLELSLSEERRGHRSLNTSYYSSSNCGGRGHRYVETIHHSSCNRRQYFGRGESR